MLLYELVHLLYGWLVGWLISLECREVTLPCYFICVHAQFKSYMYIFVYYLLVWHEYFIIVFIVKKI